MRNPLEIILGTILGQKVQGDCVNEDHKILPFTCVVTTDRKGAQIPAVPKILAVCPPLSSPYVLCAGSRLTTDPYLVTVGVTHPTCLYVSAEGLFSSEPTVLSGCLLLSMKRKKSFCTKLDLNSFQSLHNDEMTPHLE